MRLKQQTLEHFQLRRPRLDLNDVLDVNDNVVDGNGIQEVNVMQNEVNATKEYERTFLPSWPLKHKWAYPVIGRDDKQRAKCLWCSEFTLKSLFAKDGSSTLQIQALDKHAVSNPHKRAAQRWKLRAHKDVMLIEKHVEFMVDSERQRIVSMMQTMYFIVVKDMSLNFSHAQCDFMLYMRTPNMPVKDEYLAYTNRTSGMEFIQAARDFYGEKLKDSIAKSSFFSVLIDDSTDLALEKHMIVYMTFLENEGKGACACQFVALLPLADGKAQTKFDQLMALVNSMGLNGASCMQGVNNGVLAKIRAIIPRMIGVHCVAHREALVVADACDRFTEFWYMDAFANKIHAWVGRSVQRHKESAELLKAFSLKPLEVLRVHTVRWLSRGKVLKRLVIIMPPLLHDFKENDAGLIELPPLIKFNF
ncbi:hypothetical protein L7F22_062940 [Adiantum nelumboides]|nr:hypothetical protein [Adiantum nelumboides]